jgi:hypothetical protein
MKLHTLAVLSGLGAALIPGAPAQGEFIGLMEVFVPNPYGLFTGRVYAVFSPLEPGDRVLSVSGTLVEATARVHYEGTFYQHDFFDGDTAPNQALCAFMPSLCFDTFVTIGREVQPDATELSPGWPGFRSCYLAGTDVSWSVPPDHPQAVPDAEGCVLLGQFSTLDGLIGLRLRVRVISAGQEIEVEDERCFTIGSPCIAADINGDYFVDVEDFLILMGEWGAGGLCHADINADGIVGINDFLLLQASWGYYGP